MKCAVKIARNLAYRITNLLWIVITDLRKSCGRNTFAFFLQFYQLQQKMEKNYQ